MVFLDYLLKNGFQKGSDTITGFQVGQKNGHPGIIAMDI